MKGVCIVNDVQRAVEVHTRLKHFNLQSI